MPTVELEQPNEEDEDEEEISIKRPRLVRKSPTKPDPKGKNIARSLERTKKIEELQINDVQ